MDFVPRGMALLIIIVFFIGTLIGSLLPETGNILANHLKLPSHIFNIIFLIIGIAIASLAFYIGLQSNK